MRSLCKYYVYKLSLIAIFVCTNAQNGFRVDVNTTRGPLFGFHFDQGSNRSALYYGQADIFLGIPYVLPPIGGLRFAKPRPLLQYPGATPYNATYYRTMCPQYSAHGLSDLEMDEDCLYLNIYTPVANSTYKYPVMIFIHGGSLRIGSNRLDIPGVVRNFITRGVVVVSIQYRLGLLGFFTTFTDEFPPNLGMLDQVEALKFVKEEISNFGGDPYRITIFGQSAGSASVSAHTYSPLSQNLFQQAIQESGGVLTCFEGALGPTDINFAYASRICNYTVEMWNAKNYSSLKECFMKLNFSHNYLDFDKGAGNAICWNMVQDNYFMPDVPRNLWQKRPNIPVIIGNCKDEMASSELRNMRENETRFTDYSKEFYEKMLASTYTNFLKNQTQSVLKVLENIYVKQGSADDDHMTWLQAYVDTKTSAFFTGFISKDIEYYIRNNNSNVYVYEFTWSTLIDQSYELPGWHPVPHGSEVSLVFMESGAWDPALKEGKVTETDIKIANFFGEAWTNFAKFGRPTLTGDWQATNSSGATNMEYFEIGQNFGMRTGYRTKDQIQFNQVTPIIVGVLPPEIPDYNNGSTINLQ